MNFCVGKLIYDTENECYAFFPDMLYGKPFTSGQELGNTLLLKSIPDTLKAYTDSTLVIAGTYTPICIKTENGTNCPWIECIFDAEITWAAPYKIVYGGGCDTEGTEPSSWVFDKSISKAADKTWYFIKIFVHIVEPSSDTHRPPLDKVEVSDSVINKLNRAYAGHGISFVLSGNDCIKDDAAFNLTSNDANKIFNYKFKYDAINVYVFSYDNKLDRLWGRAQCITSTACLIKDACYYVGETLPHEIGHCLGLYHTHHGTAQTESGIPELVNGSNSEVAGDYISDTPADPNQWMNCSYSGIGRDANGQVYHPDPLNMMSYSHIQTYKGITQHFTPLQFERMRNTLRRDNNLKKTFLKVDVSGPDYLTSPSNYSVELPTSLTYSTQWMVSCSTLFRESGSVSNYTKYFMGESISITPLNKSVGSDSYSITAKAVNADQYVYTLTKKVYTLRPSDQTGLLKWTFVDKNRNTAFGYLNMDASNGSSVIRLTSEGYLTFRYIDAVGVDSYYNSFPCSFNFFDAISNNALQKNGSCKFYVKPIQGIVSNNAVLNMNVCGYSKIIRFQFQIK